MAPRKKPTEEQAAQKTIPASELQVPGVLCVAAKGNYVITSKQMRDKFTLWKEVDGGVLKVASDTSPIKLYPLVPWYG